MKLIRKMGDHLTDLGRLAGPQGGWAGLSSKGSPASTTRSLLSLVVLEGPLWCQSFCLKPLSAATRQLFNHPEPSPKPCTNENKKAFCSGGKKKNKTRITLVQNGYQFSRSVVSDSLRPHGLQHTRLPCPSPEWT